MLSGSDLDADRAVGTDAQDHSRTLTEDGVHLCAVLVRQLGTDEDLDGAGEAAAVDAPGAYLCM